MRKSIDLTGKKYCRLTVIDKEKKNKRNGDAVWMCRCDCGNYTAVDAYLLRSGQTKSCGCLRKEISRENALTNQKFVDNIGNEANLNDENGIRTSVRSKTIRNSSGVIGVSFDKGSGKWLARLMKNNQYRLLKSFATFNEAVEACRAAEEQYYGNSFKSRDGNSVHSE